MTELPATGPAARGPAVTAHAEAVRPIRILVVDDFAPLRRLLVRQLTRAGHAVVGEAATVAEAAALGAALAPDVVLLDFHLPDGRGTDVVARLTARASPTAGRRAPGVVCYTSDVAGARAALASATGEAAERWRRDPCAVLEKPAPSEVLDAAVRAAATHVDRRAGVAGR